MFAIINGPNLNLLGKRQPEIYGSSSFEEFLNSLKLQFPGLEIEYFQSNSEGEIIDKIHELGFYRDNCQGIIINPGAYAHYSYAIADALAAIRVPVIEVHISNIYQREDFRHTSVTAPHCLGVISGLGLQSYSLALNFLLEKHGSRP